MSRNQSVVHIHADEMEGRSRRYVKRARDLTGLFINEAAFERWLAEDPERVIYYVDEFRRSEDEGDLIFGISTLTPGHVGREFHMTRGHIHAQNDRTEIYECISGHGLLLMEDLAGETLITELRPGDVAYVPPAHIHRSVNVGTENFRTLFCYPADAGQDYEIIAKSQGMRKLVIEGDDGLWATLENDAYVPRV